MTFHSRNHFTSCLKFSDDKWIEYDGLIGSNEIKVQKNQIPNVGVSARSARGLSLQHVVYIQRPEFGEYYLSLFGSIYILLFHLGNCEN